MQRRNRIFSTALALSALLMSAEARLLAQRPKAQAIGPSNGQIGGAIAGIAGAGAAIGILAYIAVSHSHTVTGCARSTADGVELTSESDKQLYTLSGDVAGIKAGDRVRVAGKKHTLSNGARQLQVKKLLKDFGQCKISAASR